VRDETRLKEISSKPVLSRIIEIFLPSLEFIDFFFLLVGKPGFLVLPKRGC
jgi:hypothetical protein